MRLLLKNAMRTIRCSPYRSRRAGAELDLTRLLVGDDHRHLVDTVLGEVDRRPRGARDALAAGEAVGVEADRRRCSAAVVEEDGRSGLTVEHVGALDPETGLVG